MFLYVLITNTEFPFKLHITSLLQDVYREPSHMMYGVCTNLHPENGPNMGNQSLDRLGVDTSGYWGKSYMFMDLYGMKWIERDDLIC